MTPEEEVLFWRRFYSESLRLFGDKRGTLGEMTAKAMHRIGDDCMRHALHPQPPDPQPIGRFDVAAFMAYCDDATRGEWAKGYPAARVVSLYIRLTQEDPAPMDRTDAIREVARAFRFPSFDAAYQFLKREGVEGLPWIK